MTHRPLLLLAALALTSCQPRSANDTVSVRIGKWTDPETGCVYIDYANGWGQTAVGSLSIRFREDGLPDCPGSTLTRSTSTIESLNQPELAQ